MRATADLVAFRYPSHFPLPSFPSIHVKVRAIQRSALTLDYREACPCHQHCWSSCLASWQGLRWSWSPPPAQLSHHRHLPAPVKLPQFLSVQCRPAHLLIERCSEVQERGGAQCASVFGLAQKCFSWLSPLVLRSSYNKLKDPNCPQGGSLATIDMWWDKSPVLLPRHPHPSPGRRDEHVSSVCFALWAKRPQFDTVKHYIYSI